MADFRVSEGFPQGLKPCRSRRLFGPTEQLGEKVVFAGIAQKEPSPAMV
jgi:hypothetical protein